MFGPAPCVPADRNSTELMNFPSSVKTANLLAICTRILSLSRKVEN